MTDMDLLIGDAGGQHVLFTVLGRKHPGLFDHWDGNWLASEVKVAVGGFRAAFRADLRAEELQAFRDQIDALVQSVEGAASFSTLEGQIALTISGDVRGHVSVRGEARDVPAGDNLLQFAFEIDQTYLKSIYVSLDAIVSAFPVVGAAES
jgi:hypothetical protein